MTTKREAGRPPHEPTAKTRRKVAVCAGGGMSHEQIAAALDISRPTLYKHYTHELTVGAQECRAEVIAAMLKCAKKGNVSAQRAFLGMSAPKAAADPAQEQAQAQAATGKKEQRQAEALTAVQGTDWADVLGGESGPATQNTAH